MRSGEPAEGLDHAGSVEQRRAVHGFRLKAWSAATAGIDCAFAERVDMTETGDELGISKGNVGRKFLLPDGRACRRKTYADGAKVRHFWHMPANAAVAARLATACCYGITPERAEAWLDRHPHPRPSTDVYEAVVCAIDAVKAELRAAAESRCAKASETDAR